MIPAKLKANLYTHPAQVTFERTFIVPGCSPVYIYECAKFRFCVNFSFCWRTLAPLTDLSRVYEIKLCCYFYQKDTFLIEMIAPKGSINWAVVAVFIQALNLTILEPCIIFKVKTNIAIDTSGCLFQNFTGPVSRWICVELCKNQSMVSLIFAFEDNCKVTLKAHKETGGMISTSNC